MPASDVAAARRVVWAMFDQGFLITSTFDPFQQDADATVRFQVTAALRVDDIASCVAALLAAHPTAETF